MKRNKLILLVVFVLVSLSFVNLVSAFNWNDGSVVGYYSMDESTGLNFQNNGSMTTNNGTAMMTDMTGGTGKLGNGAFFNGSIGTGPCAQLGDGADTWGSYINFSSFPRPETALTLTAWIKTNNTDGYRSIIGMNDQNTCDPTTESTLELSLELGRPSFVIHLANNTDITLTGNNLSKDTWYFISATYDGTNMSLWFNGVLNSTRTISGLLEDGLGMAIGSSSDTKHYNSVYMFNGSIDEVGIWNRTLSASEINELYNSGDGLNYSIAEPSNIILNLTSPQNNTIISTTGTNFNVSLSIYGTNYSYQWKNNTFNLWYSNGTLFNSTLVNSLTGNQTNLTQFIDDFVLGTYKWNSYACYGNTTYSNCSWATSNFTFQYRPFSETSYSFNNSVLETSGQTYILNITSISSVTSVIAVLMYNGTSHSSIVTDLGSGNYKVSNLIDVPLQGSSGNKTFYWTLTFGISGSSNFVTNSTTYSQEVNRTYLINCNTTYPHQFINFSTKSAENPFPVVNATFKSAWTWFIKGGNGSIVRNYTFEDVTEANSTWAFCGNYNNTFVSNVNIEYDGLLYALNSYFLEDAELTNTTNYINLYLLNNSKATATVLQVRDNIQNPMEDVLIQIQLYDVGTDNFYTIGMGKTSFNGEDLAYLNWYDSLYKFILIKDGVVIKITNTTKIFETPQIFDILSTTTFSYEKFRDFVYSLTYNTLTQNFVLTFTKPSGLVEQGCLRVTKRTAKNDTQIYLTCETSSSATLYANIAGYGNGTYIADFYATGSWFLIDTINHLVGSNDFSDKIFDELGFEDATFYAILFSGIVVCMFLITPVLAIVGLLLGLLGASALGFTKIDYGIFIGIAIVGGLIIWFAKR